MCCIVMFCTCVYVCSGGNVIVHKVHGYMLRQPGSGLIVYVGIFSSSSCLTLFYPPVPCCRYALDLHEAVRCGVRSRGRHRKDAALESGAPPVCMHSRDCK